MKTYVAGLVGFLLLALQAVAGGPFEGTKIDVEQKTVAFADSVQVEPMPERVAMFVTKLDKGTKQALLVRVSTTAKFHSVIVRGAGSCSVIDTSVASDGRHYFFGGAGVYQIEVSQFDPDNGNHTDVFEAKIEPTEGEVITPVPVDPPSSFVKLKEVSYERSKAMNDEPMRKALASAYKIALEGMSGKTLDESKSIAKEARRKAMLSVGGSSWVKDWNGGFFVPVDTELTKAAKTAEGYRAGLLVVVDSLSAE